jgi:mono/diheme cytochrome c family protein
MITALLLVPLAGCRTTVIITQPITTNSTVTVTSPGTITTHTVTQTHNPTATVTLTTSPPPSGTTTPAPGSAANGERIFRTAASSSGQPIYAEGYMMMYRYVACADCHGEDGHGQTIYMMMYQVEVPNITWPELSSDDPPFTDASLKSAITDGIDPAGGLLSVYMPRWQMSDADLNDLVSYIKTLS